MAPKTQAQDAKDFQHILFGVLDLPKELLPYLADQGIEDMPNFMALMSESLLSGLECKASDGTVTPLDPKDKLFIQLFKYYHHWHDNSQDPIGQNWSKVTLELFNDSAHLMLWDTTLVLSP